MGMYKRDCKKRSVNCGISCIDVLGRIGKSRSGEYISAIRKDKRD